MELPQWLRLLWATRASFTHEEFGLAALKAIMSAHASDPLNAALQEFWKRPTIMALPLTIGRCYLSAAAFGPSSADRSTAHALRTLEMPKCQFPATLTSVDSLSSAPEFAPRFAFGLWKKNFLPLAD